VNLSFNATTSEETLILWHGQKLTEKRITADEESDLVWQAAERKREKEREREREREIERA
jgi:hypothetical protein